MQHAQLQKLLTDTATDAELFTAVVNAPFEDKLAAVGLGLGIVVLLLVDAAGGTIDRIALADTEFAKGAVQMSMKPFHHIKIPLGHPENIIAKAIAANEPQLTSDWKYLFTPELSPKAARFNQAGAGIGCSVVYPLPGAREGGALIFSYFCPSSDITAKHHDFMRMYSDLVSTALQGV